MSGAFETHPAPPPFTMEELGFSWPNSQGAPPPLHPSDIPVWLQEQVCSIIYTTNPSTQADDLVLQSMSDLGLPVNGSDGIFMNLTRVTGWPGDFNSMPEAW